MRIGCLQFAPQVGDIDNNLNRADSVLSKANPDDLDLLVLPELAFSGYNFKSLQEITPFLEHSGSGITSLWARTMALKYNCNVTVGYPEKVDVAAKWPTGPEYYNSAIVVNRDGETIANYRKSFLYYTDETWALEGEAGFFEGFIPGLGNTSIGICMDLNPYKFEAPWSDFEFAFHILEMESNLVIVSMAWMTREDQRHFSRMPNDPDMDTLTYWVTRLEPLIRADNQEEIIVVFCNRTGHEGEATYAGTSAVIGIQEGEVRVYGLLGRGEKELLVVDTTKAPYAKLVYRPENEQEDKQAAPETIHSSEDSDALSTPQIDVDKDSGFQEGSLEQKSAKPSSEKALPPLPDFKKDSPKKLVPPAITIPPTPDLVKTNSAKSSSTESGNVVTSPVSTQTPAATRPRLVIPQSPSVLSHQDPTGIPASPALLVSAHSVTSNISAASMNTIYSNPRRPEDSTPYPHSAIAPEYAPDFKSERKIYGGKVSVATGDEPLSPASTYDEGSPTSSRFFWEPRDPAIHSPIGRQPEAFPWDAITAGIPRRGDVGKDMDEKRLRSNETPKPYRKVQPQPAVSEYPPSQRSQDASPPQSSGGSEQIKTEAVSNGVFERPPSPKSRNASRSRLRDRSDSALSHQDITLATALLEEITDRAQSVQTIRAEPVNNALWPEPLASTKSRNGSRTRAPEAKVASEDQLIHIAACPSLVRNEDRHQHHQSMARLNHAQRSNSSPRTNSKRFKTTNEASTSQASAADIRRPRSRATSRGRTPGPKASATNATSSSVPAPQERASSNDSTRNDVLHHSRTRSKQSRTRPGSSTSQNRHHRRRASRGLEPTEFERVEQVLCPSCPVHNRRAQSNVATSRTNLTSANNSPHLKQSPPRGSPAARPTSAFEPREKAKRSGRARNGSSAESSDQAAASAFQLHNGSNSGSSTSSSTDRRQARGNTPRAEMSQMTSPGPSRRPGFSHEPSTPRAMVIRTNDSDLDSIPSLSDENSVAIRSVEIETVTVSPASRSV